MRLVDTHLHLDDARFDGDRDRVLSRALAAGVEAVISCGSDLESSRRNLALAACPERGETPERQPRVWAAVGIHPHEAAQEQEGETGGWLEALEELARHPRVVAIGEIGLDYHYDFSPRPVQQGIFEPQLELAARLGKPVVIHAREAEEDVLRTVARFPGLRGVLHAFAGTQDQAERALAMGLYVGVGGMITFARSDSLRTLIKQLPLERIVLETDAPYLAPVPHRGQRNEPAHVSLVAGALAALRACDPSEVAERTTRAAAELFGASLCS